MKIIEIGLRKFYRLLTFILHQDLIILKHAGFYLKKIIKNPLNKNLNS